MAASQAHCAHCFEVLCASLEKREPLSLADTEALWADYQRAQAGREADADDGHAAAQRETDTAGVARAAAVSRLLDGEAASPSPSPSASSAASSASSRGSLASSASSAASPSSSRSSLFSLAGRARPADDGQSEYPLFVTWNTLGGRGHKSLRGCIGTFEPHELDEGLRTYALMAAFEDTRFTPITARELSSLQCAITLLGRFEPVAPLDWELGLHGLRISFSHAGRRYTSTYLPDVAAEQGWTREETLVSLMRKAGWNGRAADWHDVADLRVVRYQGLKAALAWAEWNAWRSWLASKEAAQEP